MNGSNEGAANAFADLLAPLMERRAEIFARIDALKVEGEELKVRQEQAREDLKQVERVLVSAGLIESRYGTKKATPARKPRTQATGYKPSVSEKLRAATLAFVNEHPEGVSTPELAPVLGVSKSTAGKALTVLRDEEQIRLLRYEGSHADGRGRKPVYGPWNGVSDVES